MDQIAFTVSILRPFWIFKERCALTGVLFLKTNHTKRKFVKNLTFLIFLVIFINTYNIQRAVNQRVFMYLWRTKLLKKTILQNYWLQSHAVLCKMSQIGPIRGFYYKSWPFNHFLHSCIQKLPVSPSNVVRWSFYVKNKCTPSLYSCCVN